jgi:hypothetical protein
VRAAGVGLLLVLLAWNLAELTAKSGLTGLAERFMGTAQVSWPLAILLSSRRGQRQARKLPGKDL